MLTDSFKPVLDRDRAIESTSGLMEVISPMLREAVNYSTWAFARIVETGPASMHKAAFVAPVVLFRHIIEVTDAIEVALSNSCVHPAKMMLRGSFEAMLAVQYICNEDVERRALAWLYNNVRNRMERHKAIQAGKLSDDLMREIDDELLARVEEELQRFRTLRDAPYLQEVHKAAQASGRRWRWHSLWNGPKNLWELARHLDRLDDFELLYRQWSGEVHASSGLRKTFHVGQDGRQSIIPIRSPVDMKIVADKARSYLLYVLLAIIDGFRPGEEAGRAEWHRNVMMPLKQKFRNVSFTFKVTPYEWQEEDQRRLREKRDEQESVDAVRDA
ncbi:MAG: hypothetical protein F4164_14545 [Gemmatimonadales bacterium]|nr:hypothetical protein [Gemmatimonadales bacterium]MYG50554.1 hypothetical protein [Gemmatimonadales bacterium]MYK01208.1 hypothetical protein [Candidatus Palauibacter ramosifaciens]